MNEIKKTTLHPDNQSNTDLYPKTSTDQVEGLDNIITGINNKIEGLDNIITGINNEIGGLDNIITGINNEIEGLDNIITGINNEIEKKVNTVDNFVRVFTIPNGVSSGTLTADVKEKLCNPDGHNYYVYDDTSEMILKYSFISENEIIEYKAVYLQTNKAYEITMQIFSSNGSWRRSQTVLNVPASAGGKLYLHYIYFNDVINTPTLIFYSTSLDRVTDKWIYDNLTNKYSLIIFPTVTSITIYGGIGLIRKITQTSSSPSWGALTDLSSSAPTTLSVSGATSYNIIEL